MPIGLLPGPRLNAEAALLVEHPQYPGVFYDPGLIYIRTGDREKDLAHRLMMIEHTGCIPQTVIIGSSESE